MNLLCPQLGSLPVLNNDTHMSGIDPQTDLQIENLSGPLVLSDFVKIPHAGNYIVISLDALTSWDRSQGFLISNAGKIRVDPSAHAKSTITSAPHQAGTIIWGEATDGIKMTTSFVSPRVPLGKSIPFHIGLKNMGEKPITMTVNTPATDYLMVLFDKSGKPVKKTAIALRSDQLRRHPAPYTFELTPSTHPMDAIIGPLALNDYFKIQKPGEYTLVVFRAITTWKKQFLVSNAAKITITAQ